MPGFYAKYKTVHADAHICFRFRRAVVIYEETLQIIKTQYQIRSKPIDLRNDSDHLLSLANDSYTNLKQIACLVPSANYSVCIIAGVCDL